MTKIQAVLFWIKRDSQMLDVYSIGEEHTPTFERLGLTFRLSGSSYLFVTEESASRAIQDIVEGKPKAKVTYLEQ